MSEVTQILQSIEAGDKMAAGQLLPLVYEELRKLAASKMSRENPGQTLQPTALVHEAWLRLSGDDSAKWRGQSHFFAAAAEAMRRILIDNARRKRAGRHGGGLTREDLLETALAAPGPDDELLAMNDALEQFAMLDSKKAELVKLHYFAGLTFEEIADALGISVSTAKRWWEFARAWLFNEISGKNT
ncbi:MAG TPA: sigma-70 family RNA polymerase sigma factor [Verrucomicrobiae bacterium]